MATLSVTDKGYLIINMYYQTYQTMNGMQYYIGKDIDQIDLGPSGGSVYNATNYRMALTINGNAASDDISGTRFGDILNGGGGDDYLRGEGGSDVLTGGEGNDEFRINGIGAWILSDASEDVTITITDFSAGDKLNISEPGIASIEDLSKLAISTDAGLLFQIWGNGYERSILLSGVTQSVAQLGADAFTFQSGTYSIRPQGTNARDDLFGANGNDFIDAMAGNDRIFGAGGNDTINAGDGEDYISGGSGTDIITAGNGNDHVEAGAGNDTVKGEDGADVIDGGAGRDFLVGGRGNDTLTGGIGEDIFLMTGDFSGSMIDDSVDIITDWSTAEDKIDLSELKISDFETVEKIITVKDGVLSLDAVQNGFVNSLVLGNASAVGKIGANNFIFDTSLINDSNYGTINTDYEFGGSGNETLFGNQGDDWLFGEIGNDTIEGGLGEDRLYGGAGTDKLSGDDGTDFIDGGSGNDIISGGSGSDQMTGGTGTDEFVLGSWTGFIDELNEYGKGTSIGGAKITDFKLTEQDKIDLRNLGVQNFSTLSYFWKDLGTDGAIDISQYGFTQRITVSGIDTLEKLGRESFIFDTSQVPERYVGSIVADIIALGAGDDTADGENGDDVLAGESGQDTLSGGEGADVLDGGDENDKLDGGNGKDKMVGGLGNDTYFIDNVGDRVIEVSGQGIDHVYSSVSFSLSGQNIEGLTLDGTAAINGTGNSLANIITGNSAANILNGGTGADTMIGGDGADTYYVDNWGDKAVEVSGASGSDRVYATVTYSLAGSHLERLSLTGASNINGTGNSLGNVISGNSGANTLNGMGGKDVLTGGRGADTFVFNTKPVSSNFDRIIDFSVTDDTIQLDNDIFTKLKTGELTSYTFKDIGVAGAKVDANDRIIYDSRDGGLFYDSDGSGASAAVKFAALDNKPAITHADFLIV